MSTPVDDQNPAPPLALDFKSATLYAVRVVLHSHHMPDLSAALDQRMADAGTFFENEPVVIDAAAIEEPIDWKALMQALSAHTLHPIGVIAQEQNLGSAKACGLASIDLAHQPVRPQSTPAPDKETPTLSPPDTRAESPVRPEAEKQTDDPTAAPVQPDIAPAAMIINRPLRSGQRIYARHTDLIVIGAVNQGAEVIADGNVHVYGPLRGKAMAGARGDTSARIFSTQLDPELVAIAGVYRVIETNLDNTLRNRTAVVQLEGESLRIVALGN